MQAKGFQSCDISTVLAAPFFLPPAVCSAHCRPDAAALLLSLSSTSLSEKHPRNVCHINCYWLSVTVPRSGTNQGQDEMVSSPSKDCAIFHDLSHLHFLVSPLPHVQPVLLCIFHVRERLEVFAREILLRVFYAVRWQVAGSCWTKRCNAFLRSVGQSHGNKHCLQVH